MAEFAFDSYAPDRLAAIEGASDSARVPLLLDYLKAVVQARRSGALPLADAGYSIVSAVSFQTDDDLDAIGGLAGELELAIDLPTEEFEDRWWRLVEWINDYDRRHRAG
jgi:hypothetical protein